MARPKTPAAPNPYGLAPIQVAGIPRTCECSVAVRRGIMWEREGQLYCSKLCAISNAQEIGA